jgi:hypothetical protein
VEKVQEDIWYFWFSWKTKTIIEILIKWRDTTIWIACKFRYMTRMKILAIIIDWWMKQFISYNHMQTVDGVIWLASSYDWPNQVKIIMVRLLLRYTYLVLLFSSKCTTVHMYIGRSGEGSHLPGQVLLELVLTENKSWAKSEICWAKYAVAQEKSCLGRWAGVQISSYQVK